MVGPDMFVGRGEELDTVEKCLFQTKNGNPQHFLIEGERGIGKSSLFLYLRALATGRVKGVHNDDNFAFLCVSIDLSKHNTQLQLIQAIANGLKGEISRRSKVKEKAKNVWDWITDWEVMGVKFNKQSDTIDPDVAGQELVVKIAQLIEEVNDIDGLLILMDEADSPDVDANLGSFLKLTAERLQREYCDKVIFGLAGLPPLLTKLKASHESSPRLFEIMTLKPLEIEERESVINKGLARANSKNSQQISISDKALHEICALSEGYPHFLQQFAYCAFDANEDDVIDMTDVLLGSHYENGAIDQLGAKFFYDMYHARISSDDYRTVLNNMAYHSDSWIKRDTIVTESGLKSHTVSNALFSLKSKNIILHDPSRKGFYRLPNKSFAVWINATKRSTASLTEPGLF